MVVVQHGVAARSIWVKQLWPQLSEECPVLLVLLIKSARDFEVLDIITKRQR